MAVVAVAVAAVVVAAAEAAVAAAVAEAAVADVASLRPRLWRVSMRPPFDHSAVIDQERLP